MPLLIEAALREWQAAWVRERADTIVSCRMATVTCSKCGTVLAGEGTTPPAQDAPCPVCGHIGQNVKEVLDCDLASEMSARALYEEAATHCHAVKDYVSRDLFEKLMHDEEEHIDFLETQLDLVAKLGLQLYAQHHIGELDEDED